MTVHLFFFCCHCRTSHRYSFRKRSSGRFSKAFVDEQSESSSSENDEESEDDFIVPDSLTSTDYDYRNSQESDEELLQEEGDDDSLNSESVEETPEVDYTMDSEIDKENNGQGSPKTRRLFLSITTDDMHFYSTA